MKRLLFLCLIAISWQSCIVSSHPNMDFANDVKQPSEGIRILSVNPPMFLAKPYIIRALKDDGENPEVIDIVKNIKKVRVMCIEIDSTVDNSAYRKNIAKKMDIFLHQKNYEEYAIIRSKGQKVAIHALQNGDIIKELMIQTISPKDGEVYVQVETKITADQLSQLINMAQDKK